MSGFRLFPAIAAKTGSRPFDPVYIVGRYSHALWGSAIPQSSFPNAKLALSIVSIFIFNCCTEAPLSRLAKRSSPKGLG